MRSGRLTALLLLTAPLLASCDKQGAYGDANSIVLAATPEVWTAVEDTVYAALEARIRTVRDEKMFTVTYLDPGGEHWTNLRRFKQMLLAGTPGDPWMEPALKKLASVPTPPAIAQVHDVWARGQLATLLLLPEDRPGDALPSLLAELRGIYEVQYRDWAVNRMFVSGRNEELARRLGATAGFSLLLPNVYRAEEGDGYHVFRNDQPDPAELIREVTVAWRPLDPALFDTEQLLAWRRELTGQTQDFPQLENLSESEAGPMSFAGRSGFQVQATWLNPPEALWPAGGPFITRAIECPEQNRTYLLDAWLYAPGKDKFEYMIQLGVILDSFACGT
jgi:hypothetical protein